MRRLVCFAALAVVSCGGGYSPPSGAGITPASNAAAITDFRLTPSGVSPKNVTIARGSRFRWVNDDAAVHEMSSNPHPVHTDCPELNGGVLQPGQSFTGTISTDRSSCGFHDHLAETNAAFQGTITVVAPGTVDPGTGTQY